MIAQRIPGFATALVSFLAPYASWQALWVFSSRDKRILDILNEPLARALADLYLQFASVFIAVWVLIITSWAYLFVVRTIPKGFWWLYGSCFAIGIIVLFYLFLLGGSAFLSLDPYITQGQFELRPFWEMIPTWEVALKTPLLWFRGILLIAGILLTVFVPKETNI